MFLHTTGPSSASHPSSIGQADAPLGQRWHQLPERGSTAALALITWIATVIGRPAARLLLYPIALYFLVTAAAARRASMLFLRRVLGRAPSWRNRFHHFHCFSATILDRIFLLAGQLDRFEIEIHNGEIVIDQLAAGRGCILLGSHLGSFEMLRALGVIHRRFPLKVLMDVEHNRHITRFLNARNREVAETIIPLRGPATLLEVMERLEEGYLIGMLGDRVLADGRAVHCRFLGAQAPFPTGPLLLAAATGFPVILVFALYRGKNRYDVHFERLAVPAEGRVQASSASIRALAQRYADRLEHYTRLAPDNWFNFYDFWAEEAGQRR